MLRDIFLEDSRFLRMIIEYCYHPTTVKLLVTVRDTAAQGSYCYIQRPTHCSSGKRLARPIQKQKPPMPSLLAEK